MSRVDKRGRSTNRGSFVMLTCFMLDSAAWRSLTAQEQAVYLAVRRPYNGANNGFIAVSVRQAADRANINKDTAGLCLKRLEQVGLIDKVVPGGFSRKVPHAAEWRLTDVKCDRTGERPTNRFKRWPETAECGPSKPDKPSPVIGQLDSKLADTVPRIRTKRAV